MKKQRSLLARAGFSLVEVVLALGIATFGLVSILGLLNYATGADGDAGRDTTLVAMSDYILNDLHAAPFDALWAKDPSQAWNAAATMDNPSDTVYYFTNEGSPLPAATAASNANLLYMCTVRKALDPLSQNLTTGYYNQLKLQLEFSWPAPGNGTTGKAGTKTLYASIARR
jgi:uncharacterized protein (TIGR02598 family)